MNILLIQPPNINKLFCESPDRIQGEIGFYPPMGLMYIASYLQKVTHHNVAIIDALVEKFNYEAIEKEIRNHKPDIVGITATTFTLMDAYKVAQISKAVLPAVPIVMGGPHLNLYPEETLRLPCVDFVVIGEGEITTKELLDCLEKKSSLKAVLGLGYKESDKVCFNRNRPVINNLDILPFPARGITQYKKYYSIFSKSGMSTYIMTSRGCPYSCTFCYHETERRLRVRSAKSVVDEIEECFQMGIKEFFFFDETFTIDKKRIQEICNEIIARDLRISFDMRTRADLISEELLKSLKRAGCKRVQYGVESGSQRILDLMRKGITLEQARQSFRITKKAGIDTYADFMLAFPTETKDEMFRTISFAIELNPDFAQFAITTLLPGTELYKMAFERGILKQDFWKNFSEHPYQKLEPPLWIDRYSRQELIDILDTAYSRFYMRPEYILKRLSKIRTWYEFKRHYRMGLKLAFKDNGR